jgi:H+/Cl- antiporter ClcA
MTKPQQKTGPIKKFLLLLVVTLAAIFVGVAAVYYNQIFFWGTEFARNTFVSHPEMLFMTVPAFFLVSAALCHKFAPHAAGSGPEHVIASLKKLSDAKTKNENVSEYLSFKVMYIKVLSSMACIMGGGALGREGPAIQISASIFLLLSQKMKKILPSFDTRTWIVAGSAAGVAAAFNTPLAGVIFAIEELSQFHLEDKFIGFKTQTFLAVIVAGVTAQFITGSYVLFGFPLLHFLWEPNIVITLICISIVCGITAFTLKNCIDTTTRWRERVSGGRWYLVPVICGLIVATITYFSGMHSFGSGLFTINSALESSVPIITAKDSLARFINVIASATAGCAGGLLLPALAIGAGIGSLSSSLLPLMDARIFVATGMAAFLGAMINAPLTAAVLVLEVTNQRELILPLFFATLISSRIFRNCNKAYHKKIAVGVQTESVWL